MGSQRNMAPFVLLELKAKSKKEGPDRNFNIVGHDQIKNDHKKHILTYEFNLRQHH